MTWKVSNKYKRENGGGEVLGSEVVEATRIFSFTHGRMARSDHGLTKVSLRPARTYSALQVVHPRNGLMAVSGVVHPQGRWPTAVFYPFGHVTPYVYAFIYAEQIPPNNYPRIIPPRKDSPRISSPRTIHPWTIFPMKNPPSQKQEDHLVPRREGIAT
jgi:hypothetical protein